MILGDASPPLGDVGITLVGSAFGREILKLIVF